jgi:molybdopterin-containing oxidoreductase family membrane subunit
MLRSEKGKGSKTGLRVISAVALVCAVLVHTVTAWIFGLQQAHEFWYTALLGPWFVSSALLSGLALTLIVVSVLNKTGYLKLESASFTKMAKLLGVFTAIDLYFFACDLLTTGFPGAQGADIVAILTTGPLALFFWAEVVFGIITMVVAFAPNFRRPALIVLASVLSVLAILCKRIQLLIGGFQVPNIEYPTVLTGPGLAGASAPEPTVAGALVYTPSPLELGVVLGVLALGVFLLLVGLRKLSLKPAE